MSRRALITATAAVVLLAAIALSLALGTRAIDLSTVWGALFDLNRADPEHLIVRELRMSRTIVGALAGAALAIAGALMQALTRNPFADP
ncbi:MAG: iron chelate uptake ABC transporter family permease subunit, partial [Demequinaceae bacterium]|nr:iron chelate uptake ABC transporter family permease subunit [Demequinaceae bacterium]